VPLTTHTPLNPTAFWKRRAKTSIFPSNEQEATPLKSAYLDTGEIAGTHGVHGELKILPWSDTPEYLCQFHTLYINGQPYEVTAARVHKRMVLAHLAGIDSVEQAMRLKGAAVSVARSDAPLPPGRHFLSDIVGLRVLSAAGGADLGTVAEVLTLPAHPVYVVRDGRQEHLIPAVPAFVKETNLEEGYLKVQLIEGM